MSFLKTLKTATVCVLCIAVLLQTGCGKAETDAHEEWLKKAQLDKEIVRDDLYHEAFSEDVLIVYTVTTRATQTKEAFEAAYPGLCVEVRDLRSPDLIDAVVENHESGRTGCDVVICNDNSGDFKTRLVDTGFVVPYVPSDIMPVMKDGYAGESVSFLDEAEMLFYDPRKYSESPIENIWEMTDEKYKGRIYLPSPLRSFSTYAFVASTFDHDEELAKAYEECFGESIDVPIDEAAELLWKMIAANAVFTNSSDEVMEALNTGNADLGIMVSSKLRYTDVGYAMAPVYKLTPFSGCRTSYSVMIAEGAGNISTAKLFIDFLLGSENGEGEGYRPFCTKGTWSARTDVADGNDVPIEEIDLLVPDTAALAARKDYMVTFWSELLKTSNNG